MKISIVSPVYKAERIIIELVNLISKSLLGVVEDYEIILIDDGSPDNSWEVIKSLANSNPLIKGIKLSKNFGQHVAITAGLEKACGDWIVVMDCDLQDNPLEIPRLINHITDDIDAVISMRKERQDNYLKKITSRLFYIIFSFFAGISFDHRIANYGIYSKRIIQAVLKMGDSEKYFPAMIQWVGFEKKYLQVTHSTRFSGKSSYSYIRLVRLAINNIVAFSDKPLKITALTGLALSVISFLIAIIYLFLSSLGLISVSGFASLIISIYLVGGIIIFALGIVGIYLSKTFSKVKSRPLYLIECSI